VLGDQRLRQMEIEIAQGVGVKHALEGRTGPFQVKTAVIFARLFFEAIDAEECFVYCA
jgi:hypothetical protein